jgi:hypothetical protein
MEPAPIHERFHQLNPMPILGLPIFHQAATHPAPTPAGQSVNLHPPGNEKTGVVGQPIEPGCPLPIVPPNPPIPGLTPPGRGAEKPGRHRTILLGAQQILEVLPHRAAVAKIMLGGQQRFEDRAPARIPAHLVKMKRSQLAELSGHRTGVHPHAFQPPVLHPVGTGPPAGRQLEQGSLVELVEETARRHVRQLPVGPHPVPPHTNSRDSRYRLQVGFCSTHCRICSSSRACHARP